MHPYATDSEERFHVPFGLAVAAILAAYGLAQFLSAMNWSIPWWLDAPSVMGFYGLSRVAFERWLWKLDLLRSLGVIQVPDLSGRWRFELDSSFNGTKIVADVHVRQTWTKIHVRLETISSRSNSIVGSILTSDPHDFILSYEFRNEPKQSLATETMHPHRGSAEIRFSRNSPSIGEGEYYSGRDRENQGRISCSRVATAAD
jgi:hypothetical protein